MATYFDDKIVGYKVRSDIGDSEFIFEIDEAMDLAVQHCMNRTVRLSEQAILDYKSKLERVSNPTYIKHRMATRDCTRNIDSIYMQGTVIVVQVFDRYKKEVASGNRDDNTAS
ncbi:hypothetical protein CEW46_21125 [Bacillus cereus]|nr:hypothetical protein CEW46_21125 [Bacillus cereus]